jgi:hypothetical protein
MINIINIPDMIDQILYPESASAAVPLTSGTSESDKKLNDAVIDSAGGDDSAGKLIVVFLVICMY